MTETNAITELEINNLLDQENSKLVFGLGFPFLRKIIDGRYDDKDYSRYYATPWKIHGDEYFVCSQWFERQRSQFNDWMNRLTYPPKTETRYQ